jgi:hypothetical protein
VREFLQYEERLKNASSEDEFSYIFNESIPLATRCEKCALIAITFCAMAVEAYIYDYAARNFTDSFVSKYIDSLEVKNKWVLVPQLVTGKPSPIENRGFELLNSLIKERNRIIHSKSSNATLENVEKSSKQKEFTYQTARNVKETLKKLSEDIESWDPTERASFYLGVSDKYKEY